MLFRGGVWQVWDHLPAFRPFHLSCERCIGICKKGERSFESSLGYWLLAITWRLLSPLGNRYRTRRASLLVTCGIHRTPIQRSTTWEYVEVYWDTSTFISLCLSRVAGPCIADHIIKTAVEKNGLLCLNIKHKYLGRFAIIFRSNPLVSAI